MIKRAKKPKLRVIRGGIPLRGLRPESKEKAQPPKVADETPLEDQFDQDEKARDRGVYEILLNVDALRCFDIVGNGGVWLRTVEVPSWACTVRMMNELWEWLNINDPPIAQKPQLMVSK